MAFSAGALNGGNASLYVGDLDWSVNEGQLFELFSQVGPVISVRVCRDLTRRSSLGYAYVNFTNAQDAAYAMEHLNFTPLNGKSIRIMFSHRDPSIRKSGYANVFIKNLDSSVDNKSLHDTFATFGFVLSSKIAVDDNGQSKGYGFVQFDNEESAQNAIKKLNGMIINDKKVYVGIFVRRQERSQANGRSQKFTNLYVKNFPEIYTDEDLKQLFGTYGAITSVVVMKDTDGKSRCFGFVNFESPDSAAAAIERLNGTTINNEKVLYVGRAQRKAEREAELKARHENEWKIKYEKLQGANLYLKNFDDNVTDEELKELFSEFGTITSCKVMVTSNGQSKGYGFVAFTTPEDASRALIEMNGKLVGRKPLYVAVAQRKEERKAQLQAHFSQMQAAGVIAPMAAGIPAFHPGGAPSFMPQHVYYGQGTAAFLQPQPAGYGFQQQYLPTMHAPLPPNFTMPYQPYYPQRQAQRMPPRRSSNFNHVRHNQTPHRNNNNQGFRYMGNGRNGMDAPVVSLGLGVPTMSLPLDGSGISPAPTDNAPPGGTLSTTLASALSSATPENQHQMLGEQLYPLVERLTPNGETAKVTGMLLEMDQSEVIHLIESPEDLKTKVSEAVQVLHEAASQVVADDNLTQP